MDAILLIIGIVYGVCRIVITSVQQCTYFLFSVNLLLVALITEKEPCDVISADATSGDATSGDIISGDVTAPHCSPSNTV
jgi:hypothetical protein